MGYTIRRPYDRGVFNTKDYSSSQELLGDIERIWLTTLEEELEITKEELKVSWWGATRAGRARPDAPEPRQDYSAILIIPDLYDHVYIREMTDLVLKWIGFKQLCLQQVRRFSPRVVFDTHPELGSNLRRASAQRLELASRQRA